MSASSGSVLVHQHKPPVGLAGDDVPCCGVPLNADATASGARCCVPVAGLSGIDATSGIAGLSSVCHRLSGTDATSVIAGLSAACHSRTFWNRCHIRHCWAQGCMSQQDFLEQIPHQALLGSGLHATSGMCWPQGTRQITCFWADCCANATTGCGGSGVEAT